MAIRARTDIQDDGSKLICVFNKHLNNYSVVNSLSDNTHENKQTIACKEREFFYVPTRIVQASKQGIPLE